MVSDTPQLRTRMVETKDIHQRANILLERLIKSRLTIESRNEKLGRIDPIKSITGRSAIENAIELAREMVENTDRLILESNGANTSNGNAIDRTIAAQMMSASH